MRKDVFAWLLQALESLSSTPHYATHEAPYWFVLDRKLGHTSNNVHRVVSLLVAVMADQVRCSFSL